MRRGWSVPERFTAVPLVRSPLGVMVKANGPKKPPTEVLVAQMLSAPAAAEPPRATKRPDPAWGAAGPVAGVPKGTTERAYFPGTSGSHDSGPVLLILGPLCQREGNPLMGGTSTAVPTEYQWHVEAQAPTGVGSLALRISLTQPLFWKRE